MSPLGHEGITSLILRAATSLIFIVGGLGHFLQDDVMLARIEASPWYDWVMIIGDPLILLYLSACLWSDASWRISNPSFLLFTTLIPITFVIHIARDHVGPFLKNVAILGALVHFFVNGAGAYAIDNRINLPVSVIINEDRSRFR